MQRISRAAAYGAKLGIEIHAGHGLGFDTVGPIASIPEIEELNIGHFLISESLFEGIPQVISKMRREAHHYLQWITSIFPAPALESQGHL